MKTFLRFKETAVTMKLHTYIKSVNIDRTRTLVGMKFHKTYVLQNFDYVFFIEL